MQFTPQQLAGAQRYGHRTRIGNWLEDSQLEECKVADFRDKRQKGSLMLGKRQERLQTSNQAVPHTFSPDGLVPFGAAIILRHSESGTSLACDLWEEIRDEEFTVTASSCVEAIARNTFHIEAVKDPKLRENIEFPDDGILHYGQPFHLRCSDALLVDSDPRMDMLNEPMYLASALKSQYRASRISNRQDVFMSPKAGANAVWVVEKLAAKDTGKERLLSVGEPVPANAPVILRHRGTRQALFCDPGVVQSTEFGAELEATCYTHFATGKRESLSAEAKGTLTPTTNVRSELPNNTWLLETSRHESLSSSSPTPLPPKLTYDAVVDKMRKLNVTAVELREALQRSLGRSDKVERRDFKHFLLDSYPELHERQVGKLVSSLDTRSDGLLGLSVLLGDLS